MEPLALTNWIARLRCVACGAAPLDRGQDELICPACGTSYALADGVPMMYSTGDRRSDLTYERGSQAAGHPESRTRRALRRVGAESAARTVWRRYLDLDAALAPRSPATPDFWMPRVMGGLPPSPRVVLDFGGGTGHYRQWLAGNRDDYAILEVDPSSASVSENLHRHSYIIGDGHTGLFTEESIDVIAMFEVLEHVRNPFVVVENCARWLRPGGRLVVSTPQYWHVHGWPSDYFRYTCHGLAELARTAGLQVQDMWPMGGPCLMIWTAVELNFARVLRAPLFHQLVTYPAQIAARAMDGLLFRRNAERANPDTRGWMMVAKKPTELQSGAAT